MAEKELENRVRNFNPRERLKIIQGRYSAFLSRRNLMGTGFLSLSFIGLWYGYKSDQIKEGNKPSFSGFVHKKIGKKLN